MDSSLAITFSGERLPVKRASAWLNLEQDKVADASEAVSLYDLNQMLARAQSGLSARTYRRAGCPVEITGSTIKIVLGFFVFPSSMTMPYSVSASMGEVDGPERVDLAREFDVVLPMAESVKLPFLIDGRACWLSPAFNRFGEAVSRPAAVVDGGRLDVGAEVFGALRVTGIAHGFRHSLTIELPFSGDVKITNLKPSITASWVDEEGLTQTTITALEIPDCAKEIIEDCPQTGGVLVGGTVTAGSNDEDSIPVVYFSTCTGRVLGVRYE